MSLDDAELETQQELKSADQKGARNSKQNGVKPGRTSITRVSKSSRAKRTEPTGPSYAPRRLSAPQDVLTPLPISERETLVSQHRNPLRSEEARPPADTGEPTRFAILAIGQSHASGNGLAPIARKRAADQMMGDVREVVEHYNKRQNTSLTERKYSPIIGLRNLNNWVKSVLIDQCARQPAVPPGPQRDAQKMKVLDMGCGKGGDLRKWVIAGTAEYVGLDIAETSIEQARGRWKAMRPHERFDAFFVAMDCFSDSVANHLDPSQLERPFDCVSMQFCMHYAFSSLATARVMLENVTRFLRPGGTFLGTIPNSNFILTELYDLPEDATRFTFGNSVYHITFDERPDADDLPLYGHRYSFFLQDAVENVPEYIVHWDNFVELAEEFGLRLVFHKSFHELFAEYSENDEYKAMLLRMGVVNEDNESELTADQWSASDLYIAFAFVRDGV